MCHLKNKQYTKFTDTEQNGSCQRWWVGGCCREVGEMGAGGQKVQTSSYKINKSWGCNIQHDDYS